MIDSHCHVGIGTEADKGAALENVLTRAQKAGVGGILTVACSYSDEADLKNMISRPRIFGAFGIHPENAADYDEEKSLALFHRLPHLAALGEIGLDYCYSPQTRFLQQKVFEKQIELAHRLHLPVIIHTREAEDDTLRILNAAYNSGLLRNGGVIHCFCGSLNFALKVLDLGFYISASGIITFKNAGDLRETFKSIPPERLLIETDSPYLAPVPYRGKENEPAFVVETLKQLSYIKNMDMRQTEKITTQNFKHLFLKGK